MIKRRIVDKLLPPGTPRRETSARIINRLRGRDVPARAGLSYAEWTRKVEPRTLSPVRKYDYAPLLSIVVPCWNTPDKYLVPMVDSVLAQTYPKFELILVQGSTRPERAVAIQRQGTRDKRIRVIEATNESRKIVPNTNEGLEQAQGEYVAFMDHDDALPKWALNEVVAVLQDKKIDLVYTDEDKLSDDGKHRSLPLFKPDFSPALITTVNYFSHLTVVRRQIVTKLHGLREGYDGAQDYDFVLRELSLQPKIHHVPKVCYHWRQAEGSTAIHPDRKSYVEDAAMRALREYAARQKLPAEVRAVENMPTTYRLQYLLAEEPKVYIRLTRGNSLEFESNFGSRTKYKNIEITSGPLVPADLAAGAFILWLDPSLRPESDSWLTELVGAASLPSRGFAGGWVRTADTRTVEGVYILENGAARPMYPGSLPDTWYHNGHPLWPRNALMVAPSCCLAPAAAVARFHQSTELSRSGLLHAQIQLHTSGLRNTFWPYARLQTSQAPAAEPVDLPGLKFSGADPYFSPNLTLKQGVPELNPRVH
jgi:glycosyltransferase involved in cell wall biosynthesis